MGFLPNEAPTKPLAVEPDVDHLVLENGLEILRVVLIVSRRDYDLASGRGVEPGGSMEALAPAKPDRRKAPIPVRAIQIIEEHSERIVVTDHSG